MLLIVLLSAGLAAGPVWAGQQRLAGYPWVYLRGGQPLRAGERLVELAAVGDTNLGRGVDYRQALGSSAGWLRAADLALVNLECAITAQTGSGSPDQEPPLGPYRLLAPPAAAGALAEVGVDLAGLANNHTADGGSAQETAGHLAAAGVTALGLEQPVVRQIKGVRLAFLAFNAVASPGGSPAGTVAQWEEEAGLAAVRRARIEADAVIVSMHWGYEYQGRADPRQVETAQALLLAGADLVIGHHPHVTQEVLVQQRPGGSGRAAALSLGNFAFDQGQGATGRGLALRAYFDRRGLRALQLLPVRAGLHPRLSHPGEQLPPVLPVETAWEKVSFTCQGETCRAAGSGAPLNRGYEPQSAIFQTGQVDLTGDMLPEEVRLSGGRVQIYSAGHLTWQSPPEWRVLDLATGDPDGDGRADLVLAMEKPDAQGAVQSHPFVVGYRGGLYRTIWGGSAVQDPLREVALGDVNGDGEPELVVLEESRAGLGRALTVWRWHGWGFSLLWRSEYGTWEGVEVVDGGLTAWRIQRLTSSF